MTVTFFSWRIPLIGYKALYQVKLLLLFWTLLLLQICVSWLYLCQLAVPCYTTRLFSSVVAGTLFWFVFIPLSSQVCLKFASRPPLKELMLTLCFGLLLVLFNQLFVSGFVYLSYRLLWSFEESNGSWIREVITNNVVLNALFYCLIVYFNKLYMRGTITPSPIDQKESQRPNNLEGVQVQPEAFPLGTPAQAFVIIKEGSEKFRVTASSIRFVQVQQNCIHIHTAERKYVVYNSLLQFSKQLPDGFIRIHRSTIVNHSKIEKVTNTGSGDAEVVLEGGVILKCSRNYKSSLIL